MFSIKAQKRSGKESLKVLRKGGEIPAVFYGTKKTSTPISVSNIDFKKVWHKAGESSTVEIIMPEGNIDTLIHEVQTDPVTDEPIHIDFLAIDMNKKIRVKIPLVFEGISEAVKSAIGTLVKVMHEVEIEALPKGLPHNLVVDISKLSTLTDQVFVSDIKLPAGVAVVNNLTDVVASIVEQKEEKIEEVAPVDLSTIEVEKKGKKEEEGIEGVEIPAPKETAHADGEKTEKK